jgi:TolB protein
MVAGIAVGLPTAAQQEVYLKVTTPGMTRVTVALPRFGVLPGTDPGGAGQLYSTLKQDLDQTAVIGILPEDRAALVVVDPANAALTRQRWRAVGAGFLLEGVVSGAASQLSVEVRLWDLASGESAYSRRFQGAVGLAATMAHTLANELLRLFTGRPGPFLSRVAFVSDRSGAKELWVMRWDGSDAQQLTRHRSIALSPAWSPDGQWLAFTSYLRGNPQLFILRPSEGYLKPLSTLPGVNSGPSFSPDGTRVVFAAGEDGNTDIFVVPVGGGTPDRLTNSRGINTQPAWSPSGRQIAFTSAASGSPQLYIMDAEGSNVRRLTFEDSYADEAAWSPDGVRLAYTSLVDNHFEIAVLDLRSNNRTVVPAPGNNESPCWSPDGTMIAFVTNRAGTKQICITDPEGRPRVITSQGNNTQPAWVAQVQ